ncbi:uncharacterized protein LOC124162815 [Ischnura elegans]|uniref:uncharacterized protein LOC124162815 n=1 Tax=Ischnura elegans TaxID=197161 RepID=UPI001ED8A181|nr:uncharacterized protein LOC124162815 [Ischnura elegans]
MDTEEYEKKMKELLESGPYKKLKKDPTGSIKRKTTELIKKTIVDTQLRRRITPQDPKTPVIYGLPKIHKEGTPLRPIISAIDSPTYQLARYIATSLQLDVEKANSYAKNSTHFLDLIQNVKMEMDDILVSFDVVSLFTKILRGKAISTLRKKFGEDTANLAEICLMTTYFKWKGEYYEQTEGAPMGSPISPAVANIYMEDFETSALEKAPFKPSMWLRYVDDTFVIWRHGREKLEEFHLCLNSIDEDIKFTKEVESDGKLPFLDLLIIRKEDGSLGHTVYRKPTNTNKYLLAGSHHHPAQIYGVMSTMIHRSITLTDEDHRAEELNKLTNILMKTGYRRREIRTAISRKLSKKDSRMEEEKTEEQQKKPFLPYIKGVTDKISRILHKHQIKTVFKPRTQIRDIIRNVKGREKLETEGVYQLKCGTCDQVYVGETGRTIRTRVKEHCAAIDWATPISQQSLNMPHKDIPSM